MILRRNQVDGVPRVRGRGSACLTPDLRRCSGETPAISPVRLITRNNLLRTLQILFLLVWYGLYACLSCVEYASPSYIGMLALG